jgi:hypothetical protein
MEIPWNVTNETSAVGELTSEAAMLLTIIKTHRGTVNLYNKPYKELNKVDKFRISKIKADWNAVVGSTKFSSALLSLRGVYTCKNS